MLAGLVGRVYMGCERFKGWNLFESCQFWLKFWLKIQKGFEVPLMLWAKLEAAAVADVGGHRDPDEEKGSLRLQLPIGNPTEDPGSTSLETPSWKISLVTYQETSGRSSWRRELRPARTSASCGRMEVPALKSSLTLWVVRSSKMRSTFSWLDRCQRAAKRSLGSGDPACLRSWRLTVLHCLECLLCSSQPTRCGGSWWQAVLSFGHAPAGHQWGEDEEEGQARRSLRADDGAYHRFQQSGYVHGGFEGPTETGWPEGDSSSSRLGVQRLGALVSSFRRWLRYCESTGVSVARPMPLELAALKLVAAGGPTAAASMWACFKFYASSFGAAFDTEHWLTRTFRFHASVHTRVARPRSWSPGRLSTMVAFSCVRFEHLQRSHLVADHHIWLEFHCSQGTARKKGSRPAYNWGAPEVLFGGHSLAKVLGDFCRLEMPEADFLLLALSLQAVDWRKTPHSS